jgi:hypothetical protein
MEAEVAMTEPIKTSKIFEFDSILDVPGSFRFFLYISIERRSRILQLQSKSQSWAASELQAVHVEIASPSLISYRLNF